MGLSNETTPQTQVSEDYAFELAAMRAKRIANELIKYEHNPDPRKAQNPAHPGATTVRRINIELSRVHVDSSCQDHNLAVSTHGVKGKYAR
jgi:hypothetical protein